MSSGLMAFWGKRGEEGGGAGLDGGGGLKKGSARLNPIEFIGESKVVEPGSSASRLLTIELVCNCLRLDAAEPGGDEAGGPSGVGGRGTVQLLGNTFEFFDESMGFSRKVIVDSPTRVLGPALGRVSEGAGGRGMVPPMRFGGAAILGGGGWSRGLGEEGRAESRAPVLSEALFSGGISVLEEAATTSLPSACSLAAATLMVPRNVRTARARSLSINRVSKSRGIA